MAFTSVVAPVSGVRGKRQVCVRAEEGEEATPAPVAESPVATDEKACPGCGREGGPVSGCSGEGRIAGGLGAVISWWPVKAFRPCPEYTKTKDYKRKGQSLAEIGGFGGKGFQ